MIVRTVLYLRLLSLALACLFLLSSAFNLGLSFSIGTVTVNFVNPSSSIAAFEIAIGALAMLAAAIPNIYILSSAFVLATVGIAEGLFSSDVQGLARSIHEIMLFADIPGLFLVAFQAVTTFRSMKTGDSGARTKAIIKILQVFLGVLVTIGGAAFLRSGTYPAGSILGGIHLSIGIADLAGAYAILASKAWARKYILIASSVTVIYSIFAETMAEIFGYLPRGINDSFIGTVLAVIAGGIIVFLISKNDS